MSHTAPASQSPVVTLAGELSVATAAALHAELLAATEAGKDVTLSAAGVSHIDSSTLQLLVATRSALGRTGRGLRLTEISDPVRDTIRLAGLAELLTAPPVG